MSKEKIEMSVELNGQEVVAYPYVNSDHVLLDNNMTIDKMLESDVVEPVITHEEVSFKVGQGDSDLSDSIVDSSAGGFTIKGQTYQNILPEPSLRNSMTNGKTMQKLNEGHDSVNTVDGVCKSAILKGQTLVNVFQFKGNNDFAHSDPLIIEDNVLVFNVNGNYQNFWLKNNGLIKPNTTYLFHIEVVENTTTYKAGISTTNTAIALTSTTSGSGQDSCFDNGLVITIDELSSKSKIVKTFKSKSELSGNESLLTRAYVNPNLVSGTLKLRIMMFEYQEGMENWDIPYFEGMQSVKMPVLTTIGKNLLDKNKVVDEHPTHNYLWTKNYNHEPSITVKPNTEYFLSLSNFNGDGRVILWSDGRKTREISIINETRGIGFTSSSVENGFSFYASVGTGGNAKEQTAQLEKGSAATPFEPYKSNILSTPEEVVLRSLPNGVKDTLNLNTGEYVKRVGEIVLDGSDDEEWQKYQSNDKSFIAFSNVPLPNALGIKYTNAQMFVDDFKVVDSLEGSSDGCYISNTSKFNLSVSTSKATTIDELKSYLSQNPLTVQYQLATPVVKTVDLSSSGNWNKVVLDGSENWSVSSESSNNNAFFRGGNTVPNNVQVNSNNVAQKVICDILTPFTQHQLCNKPNDNYGISLGWNDSDLCVRHKDFPLTNENRYTYRKQYLSQNPITVWYQTTTNQDSTNVKEMLSFSNGHVQLSSAEGSLIPSLNYETPTSNSYQLDLAKTNTRYTMKAKSASGTFTIDGTSYGAGTNGTFTSPSSMTNKLLVMSNKTNEEVMIIEGDVVSKTIPYFKGIKSAFEDEDKIEVLSTGKNLFDVNLIYGAHTYGNVGRKPTHGTGYPRVTNETGGLYSCKTKHQIHLLY